VPRKLGGSATVIACEPQCHVRTAWLTTADGSGVRGSWCAAALAALLHCGCHVVRCVVAGCILHMLVCGRFDWCDHRSAQLSVSALPESGILQLDYSSLLRVTKEDKPATVDHFHSFTRTLMAAALPPGTLNTLDSVWVSFTPSSAPSSARACARCHPRRFAAG
jgi:hypothetical protein